MEPACHLQSDGESEAGACSVTAGCLEQERAEFSPGGDRNQKNDFPRSYLLVFNLLKPCSCDGLSSLASRQAPAHCPGMIEGRTAGLPKPTCPPLEVANVSVREKGRDTGKGRL